MALLVQSEVDWHAWLDEPTLVDAILDPIVHGYRGCTDLP
jgi:hypothetical protein